MGGSSPNVRTFAVVPAAGLSLRMGRNKLALRLGGTTVLQRTLDALWGGGADHVLVVLGPATASMAKEISLPSEVVVLSSQTRDMRATIEAGFSHLRATSRPRADDLWLLAPADLGCLSAPTVAAVRSTALERPGSIVVAVADGRRGHPVAAAWDLADRLLGFDPERGVNEFIRANSTLVVEQPVDTAMLVDMDTPEDFARVVRQLAAERGNTSSVLPDECAKRSTER